MAKVDKELIKKYKLEEAVKRFNMLCEYSYFNSETGAPELNEEGEEDPQQQPPMPQGQGQMPPQQGMPPQGQEQMPPQGGEGQGQMPPMDGGQGQQPPMPQGGQQMPPEQGQEQMPPMPDGEQLPPEEDVEDVDMEQEGDEVIDVDDLTQAQEASEVKIDGIDDKLQNLINFTSKFIQAIDANDKKIDALKAELERRNPSQEEKLEIRSQAGVPYTESPQEFWVDKMRNNPNYDVSFDNEPSKSKNDEEEFTITDADIKGADDRTISKSFDVPKKLSDYISF